MHDYQAPLNDMRFVLRELADQKLMAELPGSEDAASDVAEAILEEAAKFAGGVLSPLNRSGNVEGVRWHDTQVSTAAGWKEAYGAFVEGGWNALACPREFGGQGLPRVLSALVEEMWNGANMSFTLCPMLTRGAIEAIDLRGSEHQKKTYLPKMVSGEWTGTMNLTEPQAGSDLAAVRTRAEPIGNGRYKLDGQKIFITYGEHDLTDNIIHMVLARTPGAPEGVKGISLFLVPKFLVNPDGSHRRAQRRALPVGGTQARDSCESHLRAGLWAAGRRHRRAGRRGESRTRVHVHHDERRPFRGGSRGRRFVGAGLSERAVLRQRAGSGDGAGREGPRADRAASGRAAHADADEIADRGDARAGRSGGGLARCRAPASEPRGAAVPSGGRGFADSRRQGLVHGDQRRGRLARRAGSRRHGLHRGDRDRAAVSRLAHHPDLRGHHRDSGQRSDRPEAGARRRRGGGGGDRRDARAAGRLAKDTGSGRGRGGFRRRRRARSSGRCATSSPSTRGELRQVSVGAVPLLKLFGIVAGGWQLLRSAAIAGERLAGAGERPLPADFYRAKIETARFYAHHVLSQAPGLAHAIVHGADAALAEGVLAESML